MSRNDEDRLLSVAGLWVCMLLFIVSMILLYLGFEFLGPRPPPDLPPTNIVHEGEREVRTLAANEGVWRVTYSLVFITFMQAVLGFFGLFVLVRTLTVTRKTLDQTRTMAAATADTVRDAQQSGRAHLFIELEPELTIKNYGDTPAFNVYMDIYWAGSRVERPEVGEWDMHFAHDHVCREIGKYAVVGPSEGKVIDTRFMPTYEVETPDPEEGPVNLYWVNVLYRDVFNKSHRIVSEIVVCPINSEGLPSTVEVLDMK